MTLTAYLKVLDEEEQRSRADVRVFAADRFRRVMADAVLAAHEEHRHVGERAHRLAVVAGAGGQLEHAHALRRYGAPELLHEPGRATRDAQFLDRRDLAAERASRGDRLHFGPGRGDR